MTTTDTTLNDIEAATKSYSQAHGKLSQAMKLINEDLEKVRRKHMPALKHLVALTANAEATLTELIESEPSLFEKPRTHIFHGIKVGLGKQKGKIEIEDPERTIKLIRKHLSDQAELLINTKETPSKEAISGLSADDIKKIAVNVTADTDAVIIKPTDGDIEKAVQALLKNATEEALEQEAA